MTRFFPALAWFRSEAPTAGASAERELVERAQRADARAFRMLFERHAPAVHRFLRDVLGSAAGADEGTQEAFVRAYERLGSLRTGECFRPWILGIARNVARESWRHRRGEQAEEPEEALEAEPDESTPESLLLSRESFRRLDAALAALSADRRAVLLLRFDHGLSCADVAAAMGWSVAKVKVEVHRARLQLRAHFAGAEGGE